MTKLLYTQTIVYRDRMHKTQGRYVHMHIKYVADQPLYLLPRVGIRVPPRTGQGLKKPLTPHDAEDRLELSLSTNTAYIKAPMSNDTWQKMNRRNMSSAKRCLNHAADGDAKQIDPDRERDALARHRC